jgi:hypothetical protein
MQRIPVITVASLLAMQIACAAPTPELTVEREARVSLLGAAAAARLRETLIHRLTAALDSAGAAGAIDVCAVEALPLAAAAAREAGDGLAIKRTALRVRNPMNAPDSLELQALAWFEGELAAGRPLPAHRVQVAGPGEYRYYEPLRTMPLCVQCHGPADDLDPDVRRVLAERYPRDAAVGYAEGNLRGLIRVTVPARALDLR